MKTQMKKAVARWLRAKAQSLDPQHPVAVGIAVRRIEVGQFVMAGDLLTHS